MSILILFNHAGKQLKRKDISEVIMPGARFIGHQPTELPQVERYTDRVPRVVEEADAPHAAAQGNQNRG